MRKVSLERYYFVLYDGALPLKISRMAPTSFCDKTLHIPFTVKGLVFAQEMFNSFFVFH